MTTPERFRHGLPTEAGLRRIRQRLLVLVGVVLVAAVVLGPASPLGSDVLVVAGFVVLLGTGLTLGDAAPNVLTRREILTAGTRRRRRRLRWAVLRGRTGDLAADDLRLCRYLVPVVRARSRVLLLANTTSLLAATLVVVGFAAGAGSVPGWLLVLVPVLLVVAVSELALRAVEARASGRFLTSQGG